MADYMAETGKLVELYKSLEAKGVYIPWYERLSESMAAQVEETAPDNIIDTEAPTNGTASNTTRARYTHQCTNETKATVLYGKPNLPIMCAVCKELWEEGEKKAQ